MNIKGKQRYYERQRQLHVFDWLDAVRQRPGMWIPGEGLRGLEMLVCGYYAALRVHHVDEGVPQMTSHFSSWLRLKKGWSLSQGWARAIEAHARKTAEPLDVFFRLVDEYRKLCPRVQGSVDLKPVHLPTGKRCVIGVNRLIPPPQKIEVVQYEPEPLHFLRYYYPEGTENEHILYDSDGGDATSLEIAKKWVEEEFQIKPGEWGDTL